MTRWILLSLAGGACLVSGAACSEGQLADDGLTQPIQVSSAQFVLGRLPGKPPPKPGSAGAGVGGGDGGTTKIPSLSVSTITLTTNFIVSGISGINVSGLVAADAVAIGIALENQGDGYWVVPTQAMDVQFPGERDYSFSVAFNHADIPGNTALRIVGIGANGSAGTQGSGPICIESRVPDNGHACEPTKPVPAAVFSLKWDTAFDLDLDVVTPSGLIVSPKTTLTTTPVSSDAGDLPTTSPESVGFYDGKVGVLDRDSLAQCVNDGWHEEDLVFLDYPPTGTYELYANPFAACGQAAVRFTLTIFEPAPDGNLRATFSRSGELLGNQLAGGPPVDGGSSPTGLFVAQKVFE